MRPDRPRGPAPPGQAGAAARGTAGSGTGADPDRAADLLRLHALVLAATGQALAGEGTPISHATVARIWHRLGVQPWRAQTFKFSTDPQLEAKVRDVVGRYLHPPEKAVVLCIHEKPQIQAVQRTAPTLPVRPGHPEAASFDYSRHGTTTLFAALEVATGKVTEAAPTDIGTRSQRPGRERVRHAGVRAVRPTARRTFRHTT
jgi:hypothetical protein